MKLENYEVHLPNYSIGDHIYDKIGPVCESYGKKVLVATAMNADDETTKYLEQRMIDMNIRLMNSVQDMNPKELNRTIRSLWCNG